MVDPAIYAGNPISSNWLLDEFGSKSKDRDRRTLDVRYSFHTEFKDVSGKVKSSALK